MTDLTSMKVARVIKNRLHRMAMVAPMRTAVALSGGVDSCSVLASLLEAGREPTIISYTPSTHESTDFQMARETAINCGLPFVAAVADMSPEALEKRARYIIGFGFKTKLEVECLVPMTYVIEAARSTLFTGDQADGYFINNNWMSRNFDRARGIPGYLRTHVKTDEDPWRIDRLRDIYYEEDRACCGALEHLGRVADLSVVIPYRDTRIRDAFRGTLWSDVNLPRTKEPIKRAYEKVWVKYGIGTRPEPVNLHRGDSYFAETMGKALMERLPGPWRTPTGLYAAIARGDV